MENPFVRLPPEVILYIGTYLDAASLGILRCSSSATRAAVTHYFVHHYVRDTQSVDLTKQGLERLSALSTCPDLGHRIRRLHLTCIYYHETPASPDGDTTFPDAPIFPRREHSLLHPLRFLDAPEDRTWMDHRQAEQVALTGAAICEQLSDALRACGALDEITLEATVVLGRQPEHRWPPHKVEYLAWRRLWARAIQAYRIGMSAIARSQIHLGSLAVYKETKICSVPYNEAVAVLPRIVQEGFAAVASRLNHFSIGLATTMAPVVVVNGEDFYEPPGISNGQTTLTSRRPLRGLRLDSDLNRKPEFQDIARLFQLMPNLQTLTMHLYQTSIYSSFFDSYSPLLSAIFRSTPLTHLRSLNLQGFPVQMTLMNDILSKSPSIQSMRLQYIHFKRREWLSALNDEDSPIKSLYVSHNWTLGNREGYVVDAAGHIDDNLVAANLESAHLVSHEDPIVDMNRQTELRAELNFASSSASITQPAVYRQWDEVAHRNLECGPPKNCG
ncbi:hypothetical protein QQX98_000403 [Neonectria punicea]|uniref:F-box domain-containing protein n=1 Tax=Neonectria punicea TaxID=979145 RepID=A0ABR1HT80_9HYPO